MGDELTAIGAVPGTHVQVTVGFVLFQPAAFGAGEIAPVIAGGVVATFRVTLTLAVLPATSVAVALITWFAPPLLTT